jgi:dolichol-phosphate mannosyltransferase
MPFMTNIVVIPTYNEIENIEAIIKAISSLRTNFDILIVDDNSPDGTAQKVKELQTVYRNLYLIERSGKFGLGTAYLTGFDWTLSRNYDLIYEMDADFSHNPNDLERLFDACSTGKADVAIGSRYVSGVNVVNWPLSRVIMSYFASIYVRIITRMRIKDTTAGFVCYRSAVLRDIKSYPIRSIGYGFQIEMKFTAWKLGYKIMEIPIVFTDRKLGASKMSGGIFSEALWGVIRMRFRSLFTKYIKTA